MMAYARSGRVTICCLLALVAVIIAINPLGYFGGNWDDGRYAHMITEWAKRGPIVGINHWALRWPVIFPAVLSVKLLGLGRTALMVSPILTFVALIAVTYFGARRFLGAKAALIGLAALVTTPELLIWATRLNPDIAETLFWAISLACFASARQTEDRIAQTVWLVLAGAGAGMAWATRETSLGLLLVFALSFLTGKDLPRPAYLWMAMGFASVLIPEWLSLWDATGDPLYRIHVDMNHTQIFSNDMTGGVSHSGSAPFNPGIMRSWSGAGPVHLHWLIDPWINFFANFKFGLAFFIATGAFLKVRTVLTRSERRDIKALATIALCNIVTILYIADTDPKVRMFMPAIVAACLIIGISGARLGSTGWHRALVALLGVKLFATAITCDVKPNFEQAPDMSASALIQVQGDVFVNRQALAHLKLAGAATRSRLKLGVAPIGSVQMTIGVKGDVEDGELPPTGINWEPLWQRTSSQFPLSWHLIEPACQFLKSNSDCSYRGVRVSLYRRGRESTL
jgi:4-amino-4-deoxy-L-arabinose transferase-like glycosyltransferase